jgi:hypothetical protein
MTRPLRGRGHGEASIEGRGALTAQPWTPGALVSTTRAAQPRFQARPLRRGSLGPPYIAHPHAPLYPPPARRAPHACARADRTAGQTYKINPDDAERPVSDFKTLQARAHARRPGGRLCAGSGRAVAILAPLRGQGAGPARRMHAHTITARPLAVHSPGPRSSSRAS